MDTSEFNETLPTLPKAELKAFQEWFVRFQEHVSWDDFKKQGYRHVVEVVKAVEDHVTEITGQPEQLKLAFMPTEMARTSPFFPMSKREMKNRQLYQNFVIENRWGRITITGPRLSIYDESILLALLVLAKKYKSDHFQTTYSELCKLMGINRGKNQYIAIGTTLKRLTRAVVDTELYKSDNDMKEITRSITGPIVFQVDQETKSTKVKITLSPYFLGLYAANLTTGLDMDKRGKLKGDTAKALYRFFRTHEPGSVPFGLLTLCHGINVNTEQPLKEIRKQIRAALAELRKHGHIKRWRIDKGDNVHITR